MNTYSKFFETLHDETKPVGHLGRGTHYSVLRAVVFHDAEGKPLLEGHHLDFAVIWDEDHDERVIEPIHKLYCAGLLPAFTVLGERKAVMTGIVAETLNKNDAYREVLAGHLQKACTGMANGDWWSSEVARMYYPSGIISAEDNDVWTYMSAINLLWKFGIKKIRHPLSAEAEVAERNRFMQEHFKPMASPPPPPPGG